MTLDPHFRFVDDTVQMTLEKENAFGFASLKDWEKSINLVWHASGIISNGGLQYFFEQHLATEPTAQAYLDVGLPKCADILKTAASMIPASIDDDSLYKILNDKSEMFDALSVEFWKHDKFKVERLYKYIKSTEY